MADIARMIVLSQGLREGRYYGGFGRVRDFGRSRQSGTRTKTQIDRGLDDLLGHRRGATAGQLDDVRVERTDRDLVEGDLLPCMF